MEVFVLNVYWILYWIKIYNENNNNDMPEKKKKTGLYWALFFKKKVELVSVRIH